MSHYTVLVIGANVDKQLAPFNEHTSELPKSLLEFEDVEEEYREYYEKHKDEFTWDEYMEDQGFSKDEQTGKYGYWKNPKAKWDWYQIGGRWSGFLMTKDGKLVDQAYKKDVDFDRMEKESIEEALNDYREVHSIAGDRKIPIWKDVLKYHEDNGLSTDQARQAYWGDPVIKDIEAKTNHKYTFGNQLEKMNCSEEEFIEVARNEAITTFAVLYKGEWYERGKMGWWACVSDEMDQKEWDQQFRQLLKEAHPNTLLTLVDCHI